MKKVIKIILLVIVAVIVLTIGGCVAFLGIMNHRNDNYWNYAETGGDIEAKYTALGAYDVSYAEFNADGKVWKKYEVWYPSEMKDGTAYPIVVMVNGTGTKASQYKAVFNHLASWGFIVVGNEDDNSRTGESSATTLDFILGLNEDKNSVFYEKIDTANIGIGGHSQGGVGAINAVTEQSNGNLYKAIWAAGTTSRYHADELNKSGGGWNCNLSKISIPIFMVAGTNLMDAGNMDEYSLSVPEGKAQGICPLWWLNECYDAIPEQVNKVIARQVNKDHGDMLRSADGYMTAWFMWQLHGDEEAAKAFVGENPEIMSNVLYQDQQINIGE